MEKKVYTQFTKKHEAVGSTERLHSPCEKILGQRRFHNLIRIFFVVVPVAKQNSLVFKDGSPEVFGNRSFVRIESKRTVNLLIVDRNPNIGQNVVQNVVYKSNEGNWCLLVVTISSSAFAAFFLLFNFSDLWSFVTTTLDNIRSQSQVSLSQINVILRIRLKFKLYAVPIK